MTRNYDFVDECYKDNDLSLLKKLTLVIPTYNRISYLSRCLWYHAHFPFKQIIIADSSPEKIKKINRETIKKIGEIFDIDIVHLEYEPECEKYGGDIYKKWADAVLHVTTEYSEICTDKEFLIPTMCCKSIDFLSLNPRYVNAFGSHADYICYLNKKILTQTFRPSLNNSSSPLERFDDFKVAQVNYENIFQIYRTDDLKKIWNNIIYYSINDLRYGEIAAEYQPIIMGKIKFFDNVGRIRDLTNMKQKKDTDNKSESSTLRYPYLFDYPKEYIDTLQNNLTDCLYSHLTHEYQTENNKKTIHTLSKNLALTWMGHEPTKKYYVLVGKIKPFWTILPKTIKQRTIKYFKNGIFANSKIVNRKENKFRIVVKIITEFPRQV